jgi:glycosyltransferase involved in cell wall biosynthesis
MPIAQGVAARGHEVHLVAPWHPAITRRSVEDGVHYHFYKYAPMDRLAVFGYGTGLKADTALRGAAWAVAPLAVLAGWWKARRIATQHRATVMHGHWVVPSGFLAAIAQPSLPLVVSLHGSDVFVAERSALARRAARLAFRRSGWITACSEDLRQRAVAIGAEEARTETVPYGVDTTRFAPDASARTEVRRALGVGHAPLVVTAGRLVRKKGFEYLIDATEHLRDLPDLRVAIAGDGDLRDQLAVHAAPMGARVMLLGNQSQDQIARLCAAADVIAVPSVHDEAGNVDGLPNFALEALASGTPVVATRVGGLPQAIEDGATGRLVPEQDAASLAAAIRHLLAHPDEAKRIGAAGRQHVREAFGWDHVAARFEAAYERARR